MKKFRLPKDWKLEKLKNVSTIILSNVDKKSSLAEIPVSLCNYTDVYGHNFIRSNQDFMQATASMDEIKKFSLQKYDLIITKDSEEPDDIGVPAVVIEDLDNVLCGYHLAIIRPNQNILDSIFLSNYFSSNTINHQLYKLSNGVTRFGLSQDSIQNITVPVLPIKEQKKIAGIFYSYDINIEKLSTLISQKLLLKKALMQQLLTGKKRFKEFRKSKWVTVHLGDIFTERIERNENSNHFELLSITNERGIVKRGEVDKIDTSSEDKSNYKIIRRGDIGYNTMRMWQGVSAVSEIDGIISPAYTVVKPKDNIAAQFMGYLFKYQPMIYTFKRYSQGMVDDTLNCKFDSFSKIKITVPSLKEEQEKIASFFNLIDIEIQIIQKKLELLKLQKKGLMQKLLTGKIRVKV